MRRREVIGLLGGAAVAWPLAVRAQQSEKVARVGLLGPSLDSPVTAPAYQIFLSELRKLGFTAGQNVILEHRRTDEGTPQAFIGANELVAAKATVLVAWGPEIALQVAAAARPAVPIVMMAFNYDPFEHGYVKNLAQPGGNITGLFYRQLELVVKQLELLVEAFPERKQLGVLWHLQSADLHAAVERAEGGGYLAEQYQAVFGLILGELTLLVAAAANYGDGKGRTLKWVAKTIYRNGPKSDIHSKQFLEGLTTYCVIVGPMLIILAFYFLIYVR